jgi:hypothetical protein
VEALNQLFGANKVEIKQKRLKALRLLSKLIMHLTKLTNTLTIIPRMCEPKDPLLPRKSVKEKLEMSSGELTRKQDGCLSQLFSVSHI